MLPVPARLGGGDQGAQQWQCLLGRGLAGLFGLGDAGQFPERVLVHRWKTLLQIMAAASNLQPAWRNDSPATPIWSWPYGGWGSGPDTSTATTMSAPSVRASVAGTGSTSPGRRAAARRVALGGEHAGTGALARTALDTAPSRSTTVAPMVSSQATAARRVVSSNAWRFTEGWTSRVQRGVWANAPISVLG